MLKIKHEYSDVLMTTAVEYLADGWWCLSNNWVKMPKKKTVFFRFISSFFLAHLRMNN